MLSKTKFATPELIGAPYMVTTLSGKEVSYLNLDNAATTPTFKRIFDKLHSFLESYGSIHRGSGGKSQLSTAIFEDAVPIILDFLGVDSEDYALVVTPNTTASINKLSRMLRLSEDDVVFLSEFEHSANDLPWRKGAKIIRIPANGSGNLDLEYFEQALSTLCCEGKKYVAISGASNITGAIIPIHSIAAIAHAHGAIMIVDGAQLVAHREINLRGNKPGEEIDLISFSGHKMYAPFGGGVLVGRRQLLEQMMPDDVGGGSVDFVTHENYDLAQEFFKRNTAGTPNVIGLVSMALACVSLKRDIGFTNIMRHEQAILDRARQLFSSSSNIQTYSDLDFDASKKCSIITFNVKGCSPTLVAARLGHEFGIGVRQGAICQFSYVAKLLGLDSSQVKSVRNAAISGNADKMFGIVRASFGLENEPEDVDRLLSALEEIASTPEMGKMYCVDDGEYWPIGKPKPSTASFYEVG